MTFRRTTFIFALFMSALCVGAVAPAAGNDAAAKPLIDGLAHPDPLEREKAEKGLIALGAEARPAIIEATQSDDPEIAYRARGVLLRLPWALPTDSPNARRLLARYGKAGPQRGAVIGDLVKAGEVSVLLRLIEEEPETEIRWHIANALADRADDLELRRRLKAVTADDANAPLVFLAARRSEGGDRARAMKLYRRVIELESVVSAPAMNEVFEAFDELIHNEIRGADYAAAAALLREQAARTTGTNLSRIPIARLLALHAYVGPLSGYGRDVRAMGETVGRPVVADRVTGLYQRGGAAPPPLLAAWAHSTAPAPLEMRYWAGVFLFQQRLHTAAELELGHIVASARARTSPQDELERGAPAFYDYDFIAINAHKLLSRLVGERGDDVAAAEHLRRAGELGDVDADERRLGRPRPGNLADARDAAELHWRLLRAARTAGDQKKLREHLDVLKTMSPADTDIVLDVVPLLKEAGQPEAASHMFEAAYKALRAQVDADPGNPEPLNNLAWLCARSGERLPEALQLATQAIALDPDNAAYLDTAAEANFRVGNVDEAIRLETKGLESRPNDKFMREQLERFKAAKKR